MKRTGYRDSTVPGMGGSVDGNDFCCTLSVLCSVLPFVIGTADADVASSPSKDSHVAGAAAGKLPCGCADASEGFLNPGPIPLLPLPAVMASGSATSVAVCKNNRAS